MKQCINVLIAVFAAVTVLSGHAWAEQGRAGAREKPTVNIAAASQ